MPGTFSVGLRPFSPAPSLEAPSAVLSSKTSSSAFSRIKEQELGSHSQALAGRPRSSHRRSVRATFPTGRELLHSPGAPRCLLLEKTVRPSSAGLLTHRFFRQGTFRPAISTPFLSI